MVKIFVLVIFIELENYMYKKTTEKNKLYVKFFICHKNNKIYMYV